VDYKLLVQIENNLVLNQADNLIGAQHNVMQAYCLNYEVQFPNVQKKIRRENGRIIKSQRNYWTPSLEYKAAESHT